MQARHSEISLQSQREQLVEKLTTNFSLLMDGSTDTANIDNEIFLVLWCDFDHDDEMAYTNMSYFAVARPNQVGCTRAFRLLAQ